jgi:hypothetical protein
MLLEESQAPKLGLGASGASPSAPGGKGVSPNEAGASAPPLTTKDAVAH